jgi:hypothetical protein
MLLYSTTITSIYKFKLGILGKMSLFSYLEEIRNIDNYYSFLRKKIPLKYPKPTNLETEKQKFFDAIAKNQEYNPQFEFEKKKIDFKTIECLRYLQDTLSKGYDNLGIKKLYKEEIANRINIVRYHQLWGEPQSTHYVILSKGKPTYSLYLKAKKFRENYAREKVRYKMIPKEHVANELQKYIFDLTQENVTVEYTPMTSQINIEPKRKRININPFEEFTTLDVARLKPHEIGVHYLRNFNARKSGIKLFENGTANYIATEEGLAVYTEELKGVLSKAQMFVYAGRVIATYLALKKSFHEIFKELQSYGFSDKTAFQITQRAKRNLSDTSQPGGFTKDYVYFDGYHKVKEFAKHGDIRELMCGKIKIEDLDTVRAYRQLNPYEVTTIYEHQYLVPFNS